MRLERKDGRQASLKTKTCYLCYIMCFSCFCHLCYMCYEISTGRKTNKPRGRASAVSTISTCFSLCYYLLPTPPPISVRKDGGITVVYLCGFQPFFAKLNRFFRKKNDDPTTFSYSHFAFPFPSDPLGPKVWAAGKRTAKKRIIRPFLVQSTLTGSLGLNGP